MIFINPGCGKTINTETFVEVDIAKGVLLYSCTASSNKKANLAVWSIHQYQFPNIHMKIPVLSV